MNATETELRTILENMVDIVVVIDAGGAIRVASPSVKRMLGYETADLIGTLGFDYVHPEDRERVVQAFLKTVSAGEHIGPCRLRCADGRYIWIEGVGRAIREGEGIGGVVLSGRDITDRKRIEEELHERERKYRMIVENTNDAIYLHDFEGNILDVNKNACRMLGYEREELVGANLRKVDRKWGLAENLELEALLRNEKYTFERENIRRDGSVVPVEVSVKIADWHGKGLVTGFVRDISDRRTTEREARRSEERYRLLVENTMDYVVLFGADGTVLFVSDAVETVLGYLPSDIAGKSCLDFVHPEDRPGVGETFRNAAEQGETGIVECRLRGLDGRYKWFEIRGRPFRDEVTGKTEIIAVSRDITNKVNVLQALRNAEKEYRDIYDNALVGIYRTLPEGRFIMVNEAAARIMGYESAEELTDSVRNVAQQIYVYAEDRERTLNLLENQDSGVLEIPFRRKNGEVAWMANHVRVVRDESGKVFYYEGVTYDITERKKMEENLQKTLDNLESIVQERTAQLAEANTALRVLLDRRTEDQKVLEERLQLNVNELLLPALAELRACGLNGKGLHYVDLLEASLMDIASPFLSSLSSFYRNLTPKEIQVATMIREGKKTKEIAELLGISAITVDSHRIRIRKKLGLSGEKVNLRARLLSIT